MIVLDLMWQSRVKSPAILKAVPRDRRKAPQRFEAILRGAERGNRTLTPCGYTILSRARLPIPPSRHTTILSEIRAFVRA